MRKLIVANIMSLDGYFEGSGKDVMALPMDGFFDEHNLERLRAADTLLLGATTYMGMRGFWPAVADDPGVRRRHGCVTAAVGHPASGRFGQRPAALPGGRQRRMTLLASPLKRTERRRSLEPG